MDKSRKVGIGIVLIIPTFVIAGLIWALIESWLAVFIWVLIVAVFYGAFATDKLQAVTKNT